MYLFNATGTKNPLRRRAILFYEGDHTANDGTLHTVSKGQLQKIVKNTNNYLEEIDIPVFTEHKGVIGQSIGSLSEPTLSYKVITEEDVQHLPKMRNLIGKGAILAEGIQLEENEITSKFSEVKRIPISCGIDFPNNVIREISLVGIPALPMATLFKNGKLSKFKGAEANSDLDYFKPVYDLDTLMDQEEELEEELEDAKELLEKLFTVFQNINGMSDQELEGNNRTDLYNEQMSKFIERLKEFLPIIPDVPPQNQPQYFSNRLSNFMNNPFQKQEKKPSLLGKALKIGAGAALAGAAVAGGMRYGKPAFKVMKDTYQTGMKYNYGKKLSIKQAVGKGAESVVNKMRSDAGVVKNTVGNMFKKKKPGELPGTTNMSSYRLSKFKKALR